VIHIRHAFRLIWRSPGFTATAVLTMALGIGVSTAIFTVVYGVLFRPLPIADGDRVVAVSRSTPQLQRHGEPASGARFEEWRARGDVFADMAASYRRQLDLMLREGAERIDGELVSSNFFDALGVAGIHGRVFTRQADRSAAGVPCVVSEALWRGPFLGDPGVIGRTITVSTVPMTIVGVVADDFARWREPVSIWIPYALTPTLLTRSTFVDDGYSLFQVVARLAPGITIEGAQAAMAAHDASVDAAFGEPDPARDVQVVAAREATVDTRLRRSLWLLGITAVLVLILASANVGCQLLARSVPRRREMATRRALGGTPRRLATQLVTESTVLATAGALLGVLGAAWTIPLLKWAAPPEITRTSVVSLDPAAWLFAGLATMLAIVLIGAVPALRFRRPDILTDLRGASISTPPATTVRAHVLLVIGQTSVAMPVVAAAALMVASFVRLQAIETGFEPKGLLLTTVSLPQSYSTSDAVLAFHDRLLSRMLQIPGVAAAAIGSDPVDYLLRNRPDAGVSVTIEGGRRFLNGVAGDAPFTPGRRRVTPDYFRALGVRLLAGRGFTDADRLGSTPVAVINDTMAQTHWPGQSAVGKRLNFESVRPARPPREPWTEIVGVVTDARQHRYDSMPRPEIYTPLAQTSGVFPVVTLLVRSDAPASTLAPLVRQAVRDIDRTVPAFDVRTMSGIIGQATATPRYAAGLVSLFAALALVLAALGIYGLGSFVAAQRVREIGIRMALGATRADILRLIGAVGIRPAAAGIAAGSVVAGFATRLLAALLYGVEPSDPLIFAAVVGLLLAVAAVASLLPARRAARADPVLSLRAE